MQQGMLFHSQYAPISGVYVQQLICALHEDLNILAFKRAWERVVERHSVLRTSFRWEGLDEPLQDVHRHVQIPMEAQDWRDIPAQQQEDRLRAYLQADRQRGFDLTEAPLIRLALFRVADAEYRFIRTCHHAVLDGGSLLLLLKELFAFYEAFCDGQDLELKQPLPYRNYIDWLRRQDFTKAESFWRRILKGFTAPTPLVVDHAHRSKSDEAQSYATQEIRLSERLTSALQSLARHHQLTLNTLVQGVWALLLSRYSGEEVVVFGATRASRHSTVQGAESMVGLFINTLPVRVRVSPRSWLLPWLNELRAQWIAMRDFEHTPLVKIHGWSQISPGEPLFESLLVFENQQLNSILQKEGDRWERREFHLQGTTNYPLTVTGYSETELLLEITYDQRRFDDTAITRMLGHLQSLVEGIVANPEQRLSDLPILTEAERHQIRVEWNEIKTDYPNDKCIHEPFEAQVVRTPTAIAVVFEGQQLTYRQLNGRANQLARSLRKLGVGPEVLVGVFMERSLEMVVAVLGVLKAGAAYVPLDPSYPKERLAFMLEDAGISVLLTQQRLVEGLPQHDAKVICLDSAWEMIARESEANPVNSARPENLAYMMYTSGSTGKPKGVQVLHEAVVNFLNSMRQQPGLTEQDILVAVTTLSFDIAGLELFLPLSVGARVVLVNSQVAADGFQLAEVLKNSGATAMQATPATWRLLVDAGWQTQNHFKVLSGGESLPRDVADYLLDQASSVWNMYGPTETTIWSATHRVESGGGVIPVGRPINNTQIYILGPYFNPVPVGVPGELYIGGIGLARGYKNHPELVAEKFVPNPFSDEPGARLYKTGDRARYLSDGTIEFLGRMDNQVKIRGFRSELGEIEAVLSQNPAVRDAVVIAREDTPGDKRLVAYVVSSQAQIPATSDLREFLKESLPEYMVPSAFVMLDALPLTPNGKVDRHALPPPDQTRPELSEKFVAPATPRDITIAEIWATVLKLEKVGIHDNFFELGGHSLLATQVISQMSEAFQVDISLRALFENPTVAGMAAQIAQTQRKRPTRQVMEDVLADLESLSDEEAQRLLAQESSKTI
jgi:amino acid adenylation domain-containing protein